MIERAIEHIIDSEATSISGDGLACHLTEQGYELSIENQEYSGLDRARLGAILRDNRDYVTNWYYWEDIVDSADSYDYPFLRWVEHAETVAVPDRYESSDEGITRRWGQLAITTKIESTGIRQHELRHVDDLSAGRSSLTAYDSPRDAQALARTDDAGDYRPLKSAPTLQRGWRILELTGSDLITAVDFFYPASIANWHLDSNEQLPITHWDETAARQTGLYAVVSDLDQESLERATWACCRDEACMKRREWEASEHDTIEVDRGTGRMPCAEPCSFLIAAAREWATVTSEASERVQWELTKTERDELTAIVATLAAGGSVAAEGAFDDPTNRIRARYLWASLFGTDSTLEE